MLSFYLFPKLSVKMLIKNYLFNFLGDHFEKLGASSPSSIPSTQAPRSPGIQTHDSSDTADISVRSSTNPRQATAADEVKMKQILSDPKIRDILQDEQIQRLFAALKSNPNEAQR